MAKAEVKTTESKSLWQDSWERFKKNKTAMASGFFIVAVSLLSIFADWVTIHSFDEQFTDQVLIGPSLDHWLGTDDLGRDMYSRLIYGGRMSLAVGVLTALIALVVGTFYGSIAGWVGGKVESFMMRAVDIIDSIPYLVLLILVKIFFDEFNFIDNPEMRALSSMVLALSTVSWITLARVVRGKVLQEKEALYVEAARSLGASSPKILLRHILPNMLGQIIVILTLLIPQNILFESILSFIGLGLQPPFSSWGVLANNGWKTIQSYPHLIIFPGILLSCTVLAFNLLGDGLRDAFDPKMK